MVNYLIGLYIGLIIGLVLSDLIGAAQKNEDDYKVGGSE